MSEKKQKTWVCGIRILNETEKWYHCILPVETTDNKSPIYAKAYHWLFWYFYRVRECDRCGTLAVGPGLIRYMSNDRTKVIAYFCPTCAKKIPELKNKARKYKRVIEKSNGENKAT